MIIGSGTRACVVAGLAGAGVLGAAAAPAGPGRPELLSTAPDGSLANGSSEDGSLSPDGLRCAFGTGATNLGLPSAEGIGQIVYIDRATDERELVSVGTGGEAGDADSLSACMTADGRWIVFQSYATNLVDGDGNGQRDVFLRDRRIAETRLVSLDASGEPGAGSSAVYGRALSGNGRMVAFLSNAPNIVEGVADGMTHVYTRDLRTGEVTLVSVDPEGTPGNAGCDNACITPNGRFVGFHSSASNLVAGDGNGQRDVFLRDLRRGTTVRVSVSPEGGDATGGKSESPSVSSNGRFVAFDSRATNLVPSDGNGVTDVFLRDLRAGTTTRLTVNADGVEAAGGHTYYPAISGSGRWVAFATRATNLNRDQESPEGGVFVVDTRGGTITQVDLGPGGEPTDGFIYVWTWAMTSNGKWLLMASQSTHLAEGATGAFYILYAVPLR